MRKAFKRLTNAAPTKQERAAQDFQRLILEFWDVVNISFSSTSDDPHITLYDALNPPDEASSYALWCPLRLEQHSLNTWLGYSLRVREAIRQGFRAGLGELLSLCTPMNSAKWLKAREPYVRDLRLNIEVLTAKVVETGKYVIGAQELNSILTAIHAKGQIIPYHPLFERRFLPLFIATKLPELASFLDGECTQYCISTTEGLCYLADLVADAKATGQANKAAFKRATKWLNEKKGLLSQNAAESEKLRGHQLAAHLTTDVPLQASHRIIEDNPFSSLLLNYTVEQLTSLLQTLGLVDPIGHATGAASPGTWVGVVHALRGASPPRMKGSLAENQRAFREMFGAIVSERAVQDGIGKRGSVAEDFRDRALSLLGN